VLKRISQTLCSVLIEHVLYIASPPAPSLSQASALTPHIFALSKQYPIPSAQAFIDMIVLIQKNLVRGLGKGALLPTSKTFPGTSELALLRLIGEVWSTSDLRHPVVSPTMILIAQYLGQGRIRTVADIASGLFLCSLTYQVGASNNSLDLP
jgi:nucleolar protein 14